MESILKLYGHTLSPALYTQLNEASLREFGVRLPEISTMDDRLYFILLEPGKQHILASGYLKPIYPVIFDQKTYSFLNIGGVIANEKGKGYGKRVMQAIRAHLLEGDRTGLGFCWPYNQGFYEKCGFAVEIKSTHRFVYHAGAEIMTAGGQYILYLDSSDRLMEKVLANPGLEVSVPDPGIW